MSIDLVNNMLNVEIC